MQPGSAHGYALKPFYVSIYFEDDDQPQALLLTCVAKL